MRRFTFLLIPLLLLLALVPAWAQDDDGVSITFPPPVFVASDAFQVRGTVNPDNLQTYFLEVSSLEGVVAEGDLNWLPASLPSSEAVVDGVIAEWQTTNFADGLYDIRLRVVLTTGETIFEQVGPIRVYNSDEFGSLSVSAPDAAADDGEGDGDESDERAEAQPTEVAAVPTEPPPPTPTATPVPRRSNTLPIPIGGHISGFNEDALPFLEGAGMTWIKWQVPFVVGDDSLITVAADRIRWSQERGFNAFLSIKGDKDEMLRVGFEEYFPLYADFVGRVAEDDPDAIQVWNEMNLDREWPNGQISPAAYTNLLRQSYEAIKAANPNVMVVTGAPAPTGAEGAFGSAAVWNDDRYYSGMAQAGAAQFSDCIGVHYNEGIIPPQQRGGDPRDNDYPTRYFPLMLERAAFPFRGTGASFCFSELGYLSPEGYPGQIPAGFAWASNVTVAQQAAWLRDAISIAADYSDIQVDLIIVWNLDFASIEGDPQGAYAIIRPDGTCPACETIGTLQGS